MKRLILVVFAALALTVSNPVLASAQKRPAGQSSGGQGSAPRGGEQAAPRGGGGGNGPAGGGSAPRGGGESAAPRGGGGGGGHAVAPSGGSTSSGGTYYGGQAYPRTARERVGAGVVTGQAVPRSNFPSRVVIPVRYYGVSPWYYYSPYAYGLFGLGYWGWDPYWWGGGPGYWGYPYGYGYGGYYYDNGPRHGNYYERDYGAIKLKVKPKEAQVYVDGYYMGQVNDFDGAFQHLDLEAGTHKIEIRADGYQPLVLEMKIEPGRTVNYKGELRRR